MNKKVAKYLNKKNNNNYTFLDKILSFYTSGQFEILLINNKATEIEFFPSIENKNSIQVYFNYYNLSAIIEFKEEYYEYCKYKPGCSPEELENSIIKEQYNDEFDIEIFIKSFIKTIDLDDNCKKIKKSNIVKKGKKKLYSILSIVSLIMPWIILGIIALCSYIMQKDIKLNVWFGIIIVISIVFWAIFDEKSKKLK